MNVCYCIVTLRHGGTLNSHRDASPLGRLVEEEERWKASDHLRGFFSQNWDGTKPNHNVTFKVLKATSNERRNSYLFATMNFIGLDLTPSDRWH
ncbi:hypothetical protein TNCV_4478351 [Trichonephila clavipes]|nr:hypothetical protein TNCV_4478351 [Trichonephila clavipes]